MNRDRVWMIGAVLVMAVVLLMGWTLGVSPLLSQASDADSQAASINESNQAAEAKVAALRTKSVQLPAMQAELLGLRSSIPTGADMSVFLKEINQLCAEHHVTLTNVAVTDALIPVAPVAPVAPPATGVTSTPTPTPTPTATPDPGAAAAPTVAAVPPGSFVLVPVVVAVTGKFEDVKAFIGGLQSGARLYFAAQVTTAPASTGKGGSVLGTITGFAFTLTGNSPELTPAPVATPAPAATPTPGATVTPTTTPTSPTPTPTP
ncbi:MAG: hypothetical protein JWR53_1817 [Glaciihabitans sp.]|nr:hypothetical protein [Glaciihabitans sp.]